MTQTQKYMKGLSNHSNVGWDAPRPKDKVARRERKRGPGYLGQFAARHEAKRLHLLKLRRERERAAEADAKAAKSK
jgi:hypothetical protein